MKTKHAFLPILAMSVLLNIFLGYRIWIRSEEIITQDIEMELENRKAIAIRRQMRNDEMIEILNRQITLENSQLNKDIVLTDYYGRSKGIQSVLSNNYKLVLYYSDSDCKPCVEAQIDSVRRIANEFGTERILILVSGSNQSSFMNLHRIYGFDASSLFKVEPEDFLPIQLASPIFFLLNLSMEVNFVFFPYYENSESSGLYFKELRSRLHRSTISEN